MKYVFPAIFEAAEEGGFNIRVPDVKGCFTCADTLEDALYMAKDALEMMLVSMEDDGEKIPKSTDIKEVEKQTSGFVSYILADTLKWRKTFDKRTMKKTVTIPAWLNAKAEEAGINFSQTLQEALLQKLGY